MNGSRKHKITTQRAGKGNQPPGNTPGNTPGGKPSNEREKWGTSNGWAGEGHVERAESWGRVRNVTAVDRRTHGNIAASVLPKNATLDRRDDIPVDAIELTRKQGYKDATVTRDVRVEDQEPRPIPRVRM